MKLAHIDEKARARMVDVSKKARTLREAVACAKILMQPEAFKHIP